MLHDLEKELSRILSGSSSSCSCDDGNVVKSFVVYGK